MPAGARAGRVPERRDPADVLVGSLAGRARPRGHGGDGLAAPARAAARAPPGPAGRGAARQHGDAPRGGRGPRRRRRRRGRRGGARAPRRVAARCAERLDPAWFIPQVGQGALALEVREDDDADAARPRPLIDDAHATPRSSPSGPSCASSARAARSRPARYATRRRASVVRIAGVMLAVDGDASARADAGGRRPGSARASRSRATCATTSGGAALAGLGAVIVRVVLTREAGAQRGAASRGSGDAADVVEVAAHDARATTTSTRWRRARSIAAGARLRVAGGDERARARLRRRAALARWRPGARVFAVGAATADALRAAGVDGARRWATAARRPRRRRRSGSPVLCSARARRARSSPTALRARGLVVTHVACYETVAGGRRRRRRVAPWRAPTSW